jgi:hypothetical protein
LGFIEASVFGLQCLSTAPSFLASVWLVFGVWVLSPEVPGECRGKERVGGKEWLHSAPKTQSANWQSTG